MEHNVRRMPGTHPAQDPRAYTAPCECCKQVIAITCNEKDPTDAQLQDAATEQCHCDGARRKRVAKRADERIPEIFGEKAPGIYGGPVDEKLLPWLREGTLLCATNHLEGFTVKFSDTESATVKGGHESVEIARKRTRQAKSKI